MTYLVIHLKYLCYVIGDIICVTSLMTYLVYSQLPGWDRTPVYKNKIFRFYSEHLVHILQYSRTLWEKT